MKPTTKPEHSLSPNAEQATHSADWDEREHVKQPLPYADNVETILADEANDIERVVQAMKLLLSRSQARSGECRADVHVKSHGYAHGDFRVLPTLPDELAQGLFKHEGVYQTVVRFATHRPLEGINRVRRSAYPRLVCLASSASCSEVGGATRTHLAASDKLQQQDDESSDRGPRS